MHARRFRHPAVAILMMSCVAAAWSSSVVPVLWKVGWNSALNQSDEVMLTRAAGDGGALTMVRSHGTNVNLVRHDADGKLAWSQAQPDVGGGATDLVVAADGSAVLAGIGAGGTQLVVQRFDSVTGAVHWERERTVNLSPPLSNTHGPKLAIDPDSGLIRVVVSHEDDWLIVSYAADGTIGPEVLVGEPDRINLPLAIVAGPDGGFAVTGYELETSFSGAILTIAFDQDNKLRYTDREFGDIGSLFTWVPAWLEIADDGGLYVLGGSESKCGQFQYRVWKLDATGEREWTTVQPDIQPEGSCDSFEPIDFSLLGNGSVLVVSHVGGVGGFLVTRIGANGDVRWQRSWGGTPGSSSAVPIAAAVNTAGHTRVVGFENVTPSSRYAIAEWTVDGNLCVVGRDPGLWRGIDIVALADGWLVGANGTGQSGTAEAYILRYPAADECTYDPLFQDGFEAP